MAVIYRILRAGTDQCYVGHTVEQSKRWWEHLNRLKQGRHHSPYLQRAWDKYGEDAFVFEVIEECLDEDRVVREQYHMDILNSCFNAAPAAGTMLGYRFTDEQRARCGIHRIGIKETPEVTEARLAAARKGMLDAPNVWITDGTNNVRHPVAKSVPEGWYEGRTFSEEHKAAVLAAAGPRTDEAKALMRESRLRFVAENPERHQEIVAAAPKANWYTDGILSRKISDSEAPPEGWRPGRTMDVQKMIDARRPREKKPKPPSKPRTTTFANPEHRGVAQAALAVTIANTPPQVWITDGAVNRKIDATAAVPIGWTLNRTLSEEGRASTAAAAKKQFTSEEAARRVKMAWDDPEIRARLVASRQDMCWITNETENIRQSKSALVPEGWRRGRVGTYGRALAKQRRDGAPQDTLFGDDHV